MAVKKRLKSPKKGASSRNKTKPSFLKSLSLEDLDIDQYNIYEKKDSESTPKESVQTVFKHITVNDVVYHGWLPKRKCKVSLEDCIEAMIRVPDDKIFPKVPSGTTLAPAKLDVPTFLKRPGLERYDSVKGGDWIAKHALNEACVMETLSRNPHPNTIHYYGVRHRRGRITGLVLEKLGYNLAIYPRALYFLDIDRPKFMQALESAVHHLHSLGLAHNDLNPANLMIGKDLMLVLIDFGSCDTVGEEILSLATPGWFDEETWESKSKREHHLYGLEKIRTWLEEQVETCLEYQLEFGRLTQEEVQYYKAEGRRP